MKTRLLFTLALVALCALAFPQSKYSASLAFDLRGKATPVVRATLDTFRTKSARPFAIDLDALTQLDKNLRFGMGLTHTWSRRFDWFDRFAPVGVLTLGPWLNYGTGSGKLAGGLYVGVGASW